MLGNVAGFAAQAIPGADGTGVGVTLIEPIGITMGVRVCAATTPVVREIDLVQYEVLKEGPFISCMQIRRATPPPTTCQTLPCMSRWRCLYRKAAVS